MNVREPLRMLRRAGRTVKLASATSSVDAFLVSYPKSGRTWFRFLLSNYFNLALGLKQEVDLHSMFSVLPNFDRDPQRGLAAFAHAGQRPELPLILVSHRAYNRFLFRDRPFVMMVRDPRDVLVSAYFHATRHKHRFDGGIDSFIADREQGLPALVRYLNGWAEATERSQHFILSYERLSTSPVEATAAVLRFLGAVVDGAALAQAVELSRFEAMSDREKVEGLPAHDYDRADEESRRMRRGKAGGFGDYLSIDQVRAIERQCEAALTPAAKRIVASTGLSLR